MQDQTDIISRVNSSLGLPGIGSRPVSLSLVLRDPQMFLLPTSSWKEQKCGLYGGSQRDHEQNKQLVNTPVDLWIDVAS